MNNPFENTIAVTIGFHLMGNRRGISKATLKILQQAEEVPKEMLNMTKKLLDSKELANIAAADNKLIEFIKDLSIPSFLRRGTYLVPIDSVEKIDNKIKEHMEMTRPLLVAKFLDVYEMRIAEAEEKLGVLFDRTQYPPAADALRYFYMEYRWESFAPPDQLESLNPQIYREAKARIEKDMKEASQQIRDAMRATLLDLVDKLDTSLSGRREDGKRVKFYESTVEKLNTFLENFATRNVVGDEDLRKISEQAKALLSGVEVTEIRTNEQFRDQLASRMQGVKQQLDNLLVTKVRKFDFSQEDAA